MFKMYILNCETIGNIQQSNNGWVLPLGAIFVSISSIFCSFYFLFITKRLEIKNVKFQKICISNLDILYERLDNIFKTNIDISIVPFRQEITNQYVEIQEYLIVLKQIYNEININEILEITEFFTDSVYNNPEYTVNQFKTTYLTSKAHIYNKLYDFAQKKELMPFKK